MPIPVYAVLSSAEKSSPVDLCVHRAIFRALELLEHCSLFQWRSATRRKSTPNQPSVVSHCLTWLSRPLLSVCCTDHAVERPGGRCSLHGDEGRHPTPLQNLVQRSSAAVVRANVGDDAPTTHSYLNLFSLRCPTEVAGHHYLTRQVS